MSEHYKCVSFTSRVYSIALQYDKNEYRKSYFIRMKLSLKNAKFYIIPT